MRTAFSVLLVTALTFSLASTGCDSSQTGSSEDQPVSLSGPPPATVDAHDHSHGDEHQGPHDGHVIELGRNHEYHAEIVEDHQRKLVTVYILGKDMSELAIDASSLSMSLMVEGAPQTFELAAADISGGMASRFDATDTGLFTALHDHEASGKLRVTISGTPYVAAVEHHDHGHDEHDGHDHDDHAHTDGDDDDHGHEYLRHHV